MRKFLQRLLRVLAVRAINRYKPDVVAITGSVGKTTAKEAISVVLGRRFYVRKNPANYNNEIGIPITVLGIDPLTDSSIGQRIKFVGQILKSMWMVYGIFDRPYPDILVLELGADRPGDIAYLAKIVKPRVGVVTAVGDVPVHVEFYSSPKAVAREKAILVKGLPVDGLAVLNYDDPVVLDMREQTKAPVITIGFSEQSDIWVSDISYFVHDENGRVGGLSFKVHRGDTFLPIRLENTIAAHQLYAVLSTVAVGMHFKMNLVEISEAFENIEFPKGRMRIIEGRNKSTLIDDTYNSAPLSTHAALDALKEFSKAMTRTTGKRIRKIAVLGDMRELGSYSEQAHRAIGSYAAKIANVLITIGEEAFFASQAEKDILSEKRVMHFTSVEEAIEALPDLIRARDVVLLKGSQAVRLEKLVKALMAEPEKAGELLVRQEGRWRN